MPGLLSKALRGVGEGMAKGGAMLWEEELRSMRDQRLAELQAARDDRKYDRERADKLSDFESQKKWDLEKMDAEYEHKARLKGISPGGRGSGGGSGGGGNSGPEFLRNDLNEIVLDPETKEPIEIEPSGEGGGGRRRSSGRSRGSSKSSSGGDPASAYQLGVDPVTGAQVSINKLTGRSTPVTMTTPGQEFKPDTLGVEDELNLKQQNKEAQIEAALRDKKPVSTAPGYRSDDKARVLKAEPKDTDSTDKKGGKVMWGGVAVNVSDAIAAWRDENKDAVKPLPFQEFMRREGITPLEGAGPGLLGSARERPDTVTREELKARGLIDDSTKIKPRSAQGTPAVKEDPKQTFRKPSQAMLDLLKRDPSIAPRFKRDYGYLPSWFKE